jgi:hypothetical protein
MLSGLLVFSWLILSGLDILEDLRFERGSTIYNSASARFPSKKKQPTLAHDSVELANHKATACGEIPEDTELDLIAGETSLDAYLESKAVRTQKDRRIFRI